MRTRLPHWTGALLLLLVVAMGRFTLAESSGARTAAAGAPTARAAAGAPTGGAAPSAGAPTAGSPAGGAAAAKGAGKAGAAPAGSVPPPAAARPPGGSTSGVPGGAGKSAAPAAPPSPAPGAGPVGKSAEETHVLRLRDLEARVDELKERVRRSHARLSLLSESLLSGGLGGARADIVFNNGMSNAFRIRRILVVLDGAVQYKKQDETDGLSNQKAIPVFSGPIPPGDHTLQVIVGMQGHGYGVFSYLKAFKPEVKHTRSFTVEEGKAIRIEITAWEKGSSTTPLEQRPALRLTEKIIDRREAELDEAE